MTARTGERAGQATPARLRSPLSPARTAQSQHRTSLVRVGDQNAAHAEPRRRGLLRRGPRLVVAALLFSAIGDIALEFDGLFIVGMGFFAAAHVCYVAFFLRSGAAACVRRLWYIPVAYAVVWVALVALLWSGLGDLQIPVAAYSLLLTGTAVSRPGSAWRTGLGGALLHVGWADRATPRRTATAAMPSSIMSHTSARSTCRLRHRALVRPRSRDLTPRGHGFAPT